VIAAPPESARSRHGGEPAGAAQYTLGHVSCATLAPGVMTGTVPVAAARSTARSVNGG